MPSKVKLQRLEDQKRAREARAKTPPEEDLPRSPTTVTTYELPNWLLNNLHKTLFEIKTETGDRKTYSGAMSVRGMIHHFVQLEMDEQIAMIRVYMKHEAKRSD